MVVVPSRIPDVRWRNVGVHRLQKAVVFKRRPQKLDRLPIHAHMIQSFLGGYEILKESCEHGMVFSSNKKTLLPAGSVNISFKKTM